MEDPEAMDDDADDNIEDYFGGMSPDWCVWGLFEERPLWFPIELTSFLLFGVIGRTATRLRGFRWVRLR
jgi:hypothetical protein